jgi:hypothetical protein
MKRRDFLTTGATGIAGMSLASPMILGDSAVGANDKIVLAVDWLRRTWNAVYCQLLQSQREC